MGNLKNALKRINHKQYVREIGADDCDVWNGAPASNMFILLCLVNLRQQLSEHIDGSLSAEHAARCCS